MNIMMSDEIIQEAGLSDIAGASPVCTGSEVDTTGMHSK